MKIFQLKAAFRSKATLLSLVSWDLRNLVWAFCHLMRRTDFHPDDKRPNAPSHTRPNIYFLYTLQIFVRFQVLSVISSKCTQQINRLQSKTGQSWVRSPPGAGLFSSYLLSFFTLWWIILNQMPLVEVAFLIRRIKPFTNGYLAWLSGWKTGSMSRRCKTSSLLIKLDGWPKRIRRLCYTYN